MKFSIGNTHKRRQKAPFFQRVRSKGECRLRPSKLCQFGLNPSWWLVVGVSASDNHQRTSMPCRIEHFGLKMRYVTFTSQIAELHGLLDPSG